MSNDYKGILHSGYRNFKFGFLNNGNFLYLKNSQISFVNVLLFHSDIT